MTIRILSNLLCFSCHTFIHLESWRAGTISDGFLYLQVDSLIKVLEKHPIKEKPSDKVFFPDF